MNNQISEKIDKAVHLKREGKFEEANNIYIKLNQENPNTPQILKSWAVTLTCLGKYSFAEEYMLRASFIFATNVDEYNALQCMDQAKKIKKIFKFIIIIYVQFRKFITI